MPFKALNNREKKEKDSFLLNSHKTKRSQSALEYMITYGWAILIIVIVAVILYSMGIFNPSSSISTTVTGFAGLGSVSAQCFPGGGLVLSLGDSLGVPIQITKITTTNQNGKLVSVNFSSIISASGLSYFVLADSCSNNSGMSFSNKISVMYKEPGQPLPGPYISSGAITGKTISQGAVANFNGNNAYIYAPVGSWLGTNHAFTIVAWVYSPAGLGGTIANICTSPTCGGWSTPFLGYNNSGTGYIYAWINGPPTLGLPATFGKWYFSAITYSATSSFQELYVNKSTVSGSGTYSPSDSFDYITIGSDPTGQHESNQYFTGEIFDVQIYNTTLSASQIQDLYNNGFGAAPITNNGLVAWWPLDGNANDYSGYNNKGVAINVKWVSP